jgi:hypothetical protein
MVTGTIIASGQQYHPRHLWSQLPPHFSAVFFCPSAVFSFCPALNADRVHGIP